MNNFLLGLVILSVFGMVLFTSQGFGNSLITLSEVNKIKTLQISDSSTKTLVGTNLGTDNDISSVTLTFKNTIEENDTVNISFKDGNGVEIGNGFTTVSPSSSVISITLSNSVTSIERDVLRSVSITVT